jgi:hypothetical protein
VRKIHKKRKGNKRREKKGKEEKRKEKNVVIERRNHDVARVLGSCEKLDKMHHEKLFEVGIILSFQWSSYEIMIQLCSRWPLKRPRIWRTECKRDEPICVPLCKYRKQVAS